MPRCPRGSTASFLENATFDNVTVDQIAFLTRRCRLWIRSHCPTAAKSRVSGTSGPATLASRARARRARRVTNLATVHGVTLGCRRPGRRGGRPQSVRRVVAHYNPANGSMYVAQIQNVTTTTSVTTAKIFKDLGRHRSTVQTAIVLQAPERCAWKCQQRPQLFFGPTGGPLPVSRLGLMRRRSPRVSSHSRQQERSFDNFATDAISLTTPALPFADDFTQLDGSQLSTNWLERPATSPSWATLSPRAPQRQRRHRQWRGAEQRHPGGPRRRPINGQAAGVVARYSTSGYYFAQISFNGSVYQAAFTSRSLASSPP